MYVLTALIKLCRHIAKSHLSLAKAPLVILAVALQKYTELICMRCEQFSLKTVIVYGNN